MCNTDLVLDSLARAVSLEAHLPNRSDQIYTCNPVVGE